MLNSNSGISIDSSGNVKVTAQTAEQVIAAIESYISTGSPRGVVCMNQPGTAKVFINFESGTIINFLPLNPALAVKSMP